MRFILKSLAMKINKFNLAKLALSTTLAIGLIAGVSAANSQNPLAVSDLGSSYTVAAGHEDKQMQDDKVHSRGNREMMQEKKMIQEKMEMMKEEMRMMKEEMRILKKEVMWKIANIYVVEEEMTAEKVTEIQSSALMFAKEELQMIKEKLEKMKIEKMKIDIEMKIMKKAIATVADADTIDKVKQEAQSFVETEMMKEEREMMGLELSLLSLRLERIKEEMIKEEIAKIVDIATITQELQELPEIQADIARNQVREVIRLLGGIKTRIITACESDGVVPKNDFYNAAMLEEFTIRLESDPTTILSYNGDGKTATVIAIFKNTENVNKVLHNKLLTFSTENCGKSWICGGGNSNVKEEYLPVTCRG